MFLSVCLCKGYHAIVEKRWASDGENVCIAQYIQAHHHCGGPGCHTFYERA